MSQHASTANHDDQRKSHTLITDAQCVLARVHLIRVLIIVFNSTVVCDNCSLTDFCYGPTHAPLMIHSRASLDPVSIGCSLVACALVHL